MRNEKTYKNFIGDTGKTMSVDLDLENTNDFVNQVTYNPDGLFDFLDPDDVKVTSTTGVSSTLDSDQDGIPDMIDIDAGSGTGKPTTQSKPAPRANRGQGLGTFAEGLAKGLGLYNRGATPQPIPTEVQPTTASTGVSTSEGKNWVIPVLVGGIGIAILVLAINTMKKSGSTPAPATPMVEA